MSGFFAMIKQSLNMSASAAGKISGKVARDRLSVMLVHQRNSDFVQNIDMEALQAEVAAVIKKYIKCAEKPASLALKQDGEFDYLEMHFPLEQNSLASQQIAVNLKKTAHGHA
jgi:cell division topological specificity factor MinE